MARDHMRVCKSPHQVLEMEKLLPDDVGTLKSLFFKQAKEKQLL